MKVCLYVKQSVAFLESVPVLNKYCIDKNVTLFFSELSCRCRSGKSVKVYGHAEAVIAVFGQSGF